MSRVEVAFSGAITCGESPVWAAGEKALYFTDIPGKTLNRLDVGAGQHRSWEMPEELCCFAMREQGGFVAGMRSGFAFLDAETGAVTPIARPEAHKPDNRLNDGRCDRQGRFWAGSMHEPRLEFDGVLYCLDTDKNCVARAGAVMVANGLAWSPDSTKMYWSDSRNQKIFVFDFDPVTGDVENRRLFFETNDEQGRPDGAAVDAEGFYWSACYRGGRILRIAPDGRVDREIKMPVRDITMVCFGGEDLDTLYITTSREGYSAAACAESPLAGAIFVTDPGVKGLAETSYKG